MIYFIFWTLLILVMAFSVPVVNAIEKKKRLAAMAQPEPEEMADDEMIDDEAGFGDEAEMIEEQSEEVVDEFGAFDEEFK